MKHTINSMLITEWTAQRVVVAKMMRIMKKDNRMGPNQKEG